MHTTISQKKKWLSIDNGNSLIEHAMNDTEGN